MAKHARSRVLGLVAMAVGIFSGCGCSAALTCNPSKMVGVYQGVAMLLGCTNIDAQVNTANVNALFNAKTSALLRCVQTSTSPSSDCLAELRKIEDANTNNVVGQLAKAIDLHPETACPCTITASHGDANCLSVISVLGSYCSALGYSDHNIAELCVNEISKYCPGQRSFEAILTCLQQNATSIESGCRDLVAASLQVIVQACAGDILQFCPDQLLNQNYVGIFTCLIENTSQLSTTCSQKVGKYEIPCVTEAAQYCSQYSQNFSLAITCLQVHESDLTAACQDMISSFDKCAHNRISHNASGSVNGPPKPCWEENTDDGSTGTDSAVDEGVTNSGKQSGPRRLLIAVLVTILVISGCMAGYIRFCRRENNRGLDRRAYAKAETEDDGTELGLINPDDDGPPRELTPRNSGLASV